MKTPPFEPTPTAPLAGIRVVELCRGLAGRTASRLLADVGAEVVRLVDTQPNGSPSVLPILDAATMSGDRGKWIAPTTSEAAQDVTLDALLAHADVFVTDLGPAELHRRGLDERTLRARHSYLIHAWLPPYGTRGRWADLAPDPLLLSALSGFADYFPASQDRPVAPVVPAPTYIQGAMGAAGVVTALVGRERNGAAPAFTVTGLQACASLLLALFFNVLDAPPPPNPARVLRGSPSFRLYQGRDGAWFFLGALSPDIFLRALDVMDRMDVMVLPGVDGEFMNLYRPEVNAVVSPDLERTFREADAATWIERFQAAAIPAAPVLSRFDWLDNDIVVSNQVRHEATHPQLGIVTMPGVPLLLNGHAPALRHLPTHDVVVSAAGLWSTDVRTASSVESAPETATQTDDGGARLPLAGLKVVDLTTFLAGPFAGATLAECGADVVKVEGENGDPYRVFNLPHLIVNKRKRIVALDLHTADGMAVLTELLKSADVMIDNFRPAIRARLGLTPERLAGINPRLVHGNLTAYGQAGAAADLPGFDPVMQSLSGMALAQGGDGEPVTVGAPVNDLAGGALLAFGVALGLFYRARTGQPLAAVTSLAAAATFLQSVELTRFEGCPIPPCGGTDHLGPSNACRYYEAADGWLAVAARSAQEETAFVSLVGVDPSDLPGTHGRSDDEAMERAIKQRSVEAWLDDLVAAGIPACKVLRREGASADAFLVENDYMEIHHHVDFGRVLGMRAFSDWAGTNRAPLRIGGPVGAHTAEVLADLGHDIERIEKLFTSGAAVGPCPT